MTTLKLDDNGSLVFPLQLVTGAQEVIQRVEVRLRTFAGEWILDETVGVPWLEWSSTKEPPDDEIAAVVVREIEDIEGVASALVRPVDNDDPKTVALEGEIELDPNVQDGATVGIELGVAPGDPSARIVNMEAFYV